MDSFKNAYRDEDNILDQIHLCKYVRNFIMMILILITLYELHTNIGLALKPNFMSFLL